MKWDFETGAGRVDLTKERGMSQEARQGRVQRGGGLHAGVETSQHCYWTAVHGATGLQSKESFGVWRPGKPREQRGVGLHTCWTRPLKL